MEHRHRRSVRETTTATGRIGWTVSNDTGGPTAEQHLNNGTNDSVPSGGFLSASPFGSVGADNSARADDGDGRIYPRLFAENEDKDDDDDHADNEEQRNGNSGGNGKTNAKSVGSGPSRNTGTNNCWPSVQSVTMEEQEEDWDDANCKQQNYDDEEENEAEQNVGTRVGRPFGTTRNSDNSVPVVVGDRHPKKDVSRRSLPASFQHQLQLLSRCSPQQQQRPQDVQPQHQLQHRRHRAVVDEDDDDDDDDHYGDKSANERGNGGNGTGFWQFFDSNYVQFVAHRRRYTWDANMLSRQQTLVIFLIGLSLLLLFVLPPLVSALFSSSSSFTDSVLSSSDRLRIFRADLQQVLNQAKYANFGSRTKYSIERTLNYLAEQMLRRRRQQNNSQSVKNDGHNKQTARGGGTFGQYHPAPLVLLISSSFSHPTFSSSADVGPIAYDDVDEIAEQYAVLLLKHWPEYRFINATAQPVYTKSDLSNLLMRPLLVSNYRSSNKTPWLWWWWPSSDYDDDGDTVLVLFHRIERLRGDAPLFLHSLADPESSPIVEAAGRHNVLIILTMSASDHNKQPQQQHGIAETDTDYNDGTGNGAAPVQPDCEAEIASSLLSNWQSDAVTEDQIRPIVARISAIPLCVF